MSGEASESSPRGSPPSSPSSAGLAGPGPGPLISAPAAPCSSGPGLPRSSGESPQAALPVAWTAHIGRRGRRRTAPRPRRVGPGVIFRGSGPPCCVASASRDVTRRALPPSTPPAATEQSLLTPTSYTEQSLTPTSYAGVLLGLRSTSTPSTPPAAKLPGPIDSPIKSSLSLLPPLPPQMPLIPQIAPSSSSLNHLNAPLVRCSRRLAAQAELTGGSRVYNRDDRTS